MRIDQKQARYLGIALIVLGAIAVLKFWGLVLPLTLGGLGGFLYMQRRQMGRIGEAVQFGLWLIGSALLLLVNFFVPGVLLLGGASLLLRGRESEVDRKVQYYLGRIQARLSNRQQPGAQSVPVQHPPQDHTNTAQAQTEDDDAATGKTIRL